MIGEIVHNFSISGGLIAKRRGAGTFTNGIFTHSAATDITLDPVAAHPATGQDLRRLPEGDRVSDVWAFYTSIPLRTTRENSYEADVIVKGAELYQVVHVEDWSERGGFWRVLAVKVQATI
jgi:hypothetical protein